ncbi:MAG: hypothetical protein IT204_00950 [Fimbriimonadaceae bacterium]|nr:hypothetical protein [Fimbriimonadaceae bacterium]
MNRPGWLLGVDPGHQKCGLALLDDGGPVWAAVVPTASVAATLQELASSHPIRQVVLGNGTRSREFRRLLQEHLPAAAVALLDETGTTLAARSRYWQEHPPRGLWRLVPTTMRLPPVPFDDLVARLLAERWLAAQAAAAEPAEKTGGAG